MNLRTAIAASLQIGVTPKGWKVRHEEEEDGNVMLGYLFATGLWIKSSSHSTLQFLRMLLKRIAPVFQVRACMWNISRRFVWQITW